LSSIRERIARETAPGQPLNTFGRCCCWTVITLSLVVGVFAPMARGETLLDRVAFITLIDAAWIYILVSDARRRR
jgi:hypothetical protein